jgi:hemerythrin-like domain-containing protein
MPDVGSPYADTSDMYAAHDVFRREFALLPGLVRSVPASDTDRVRDVAGHISLMNELLHHPHSAEDAVLWPRLLARAPKEIDPVVHLAEGHHLAIEGLLEETGDRLSAWADGVAGDDGDSLADTLQRLAAALYEHMGLEEKLILPLVERHIFATEWNDMVERLGAGIRPEIGLIAAGMMMYEAGLDPLPEAMRAGAAEVAPQAYAAHCERVHGTPTPPRSTEVIIRAPYIGVPALTH